MSTPSTAIVSESTCRNPNGCQFTGPDSEFYWRDDIKLCGHCMDAADNADMPSMVSEYSYHLRKALDD